MRQFADVAGISNAYLSQIERGVRAPSEAVLDGIAGALRVSADTLYRQAGVAAPGDPDPAVLEAIGSDERLTRRQRTALREVYEAFVAANQRTPPARRRGRSKS